MIEQLSSTRLWPPAPSHLDMVKHDGLAAHALEGTDRRVDTTGKQLLRLLEDLQAWQASCGNGGREGGRLATGRAGRVLACIV